MSIVATYMLFALVTALTESTDTIWDNSVGDSTGFNISGIVNCDMNSDYCFGDCAQIIATVETSSHLQTVAIDAIGYDNIELHISFALGDG